MQYNGVASAATAGLCVDRKLQIILIPEGK